MKYYLQIYNLRNDRWSADLLSTSPTYIIRYPAVRTILGPFDSREEAKGAWLLLGRKCVLMEYHDGKMGFLAGF